MKAKSLIISLILIVCFAGIGIGLYCAWPAITGTITDSKYYTSEDLQEAYDKGFDDAFKNKDELTQQVDYYKELTDTYYVSILDYQAQIKDYETLTENNKNTISTLEQNKTELQSQVDNLTTIKNSNEKTISDLQVEISNLENQVKILTNSDSGKTEEIAELNKQITSLNNLISQLQNTNTLNVNTIASLNSQIESLNTQISNMTLQNQNANSQITSLNNKISELQESINYYEQYIASLENGEQVVATFEFDGSVYNIQIVNKNSIVTVTTPTSTDYVIFNYWTVNGEQVDLSAYQITTNTKFVADVTHKYDVKFKVDNSDYDGQIVAENGYATLPEEPTKVGYEFDGWSLNGVDVVENISSTAVTQNVTYQAVFTKLHTATFMYEDEVKSTQQVRNGEYATDVEVEDTIYKVFNGWKVNGSFVDVESYKINADTIFVADVTYKYDVKFLVDNEEYDHQIIIENGVVTLPEEPTKAGYEFDGWSLNGVDVVENIPTTAVTQNVVYKAVFTKLHTVTFMCEDEVISTQQIRNGECAVLPTDPTRENFVFKGWSITNGGEVVENINNIIVTNNTTYYAIFKINKFTVTFVNDSEIIDTQSVDYNNFVKLPEDPIRKDYRFLGWSLTQNGEILNDISSYVIKKDTVFYAIFKLAVDGVFINSEYGLELVVENGVLVSFTGENRLYNIVHESESLSSFPDNMTGFYNHFSENDKISLGNYYTALLAGKEASSSNYKSLIYNVENDTWLLSRYYSNDMGFIHQSAFASFTLIRSV